MLILFTFLLKRIFLTLNNVTNTNNEECSLENPCSFLSENIQNKLLNFTEIQIMDEYVMDCNMSIFFDLLQFCAQNSIYLYGNGQHINAFNHSLRLANSNVLALENFSFSNIRNSFLFANQAKILFQEVTFVHSRSQIFKLNDSFLECYNCKFISNYISNKSMISLNHSFSFFSNCIFDKISQTPTSSKAIFNAYNCNVTILTCTFSSSYINNDFFNLIKTEFTFLDNYALKMLGSNFIRGKNSTLITITKSSFLDNQCALVILEQDSRYNCVEVSINHTCINNGIIQSYDDSIIDISSSLFFHNSCGPIINSTKSKIDISSVLFINNISPYELLSFNSSIITLFELYFENTTTVYESAIKSSHSILEITNLCFNFSYTRSHSASIHASNTSFRGSNLTFFNIQSMLTGTALYFSECTNQRFLIDKSIFNNSINKSDSPICIEDHKCQGSIYNTMFYGYEEFSNRLYELCFNCSFYDQKSKRIDIGFFDSDETLFALIEDPINHSLELVYYFVYFLIFLIILIFVVKKWNNIIKYFRIFNTKAL